MGYFMTVICSVSFGFIMGAVWKGLCDRNELYDMCSKEADNGEV